MNETNSKILYERMVTKLKKMQLNPNSKKELIQLQLQHFYDILDKQVRLRFISDIKEYVKELKTDILVDNGCNQTSHNHFFDIERKIRKNTANDYTVNYMISGFLDEYEIINSKELKDKLLDFITKLIFNLHKMTGMNYQDDFGGGYVLYVASLSENEDYYVGDNPQVMFSYTDDFKNKGLTI